VYTDTELYSTTEEDTCSITVNDLDASDRITFGSGTAGSTLWSNATGNWGAGAMMTINLTTNATWTINQVCISLEDTDLDTNIHWENISFNLKNGTNSSWVAGGIKNFGTYGSSNFTINASTWDTDWGTSPFTTDGSGGLSELNNTGNATYNWYVRFRLEVPNDATANTFSTDAWKIYYEYDVEI
jgi:hypothetical protein